MNSNNPNDEDTKHLELKSIRRLDQQNDAFRVKDKEDNLLKLVETVFDNKTRLILFSLINKGKFTEIEGAISTGKEANVYYAKTKDDAIAIKIFRIDAPSFRKMKPYIEGDHRFKRFKSSRSGFIEAWAKKEFKNLKRMRVHNIPAPQPILVERNILLMEFLGDGESVLPRLKDTTPEKPNKLYRELLESVKTMYRKCKLVHADLSEYNILYNPQNYQFFIIDVSQSVLTDHPKALAFLLRDLKNINNYFKSNGVKVIDIEKMFKWVTGQSLDINLIL